MKTDALILLSGKVEVRGNIAVIHDVIAAREGVNGRGEYKPWAALVEGAPSMEGVPLTYGHPQDRSGVVVEVDARDGVGFARNVRAQESDRTIRYDAYLFLEKPEGSLITDADVERNRALVEHVANGGVVDNSIGYWTTERKEEGVFMGRKYDLIQEGLRFGHVAILKPFTRDTGACSIKDGCGFGLDHEGSCQGGEGCCKTRMESHVKDIMDSLNVSRLTALSLIRGAGQR